MPNLAGTSSVFVDVEFGHVEFALVALGDVVKNRGYHAAWSTPFGPKIDQDGCAGLHHLLVEFGVGGVLDEIAGHGVPLFREPLWVIER